MKKHFLSLALVWLCATASSFAQSPIKIGYTNIEYIIASLPDAKQVEADLKEYEAIVTKELQAKEQEFKQKFEQYKIDAPKLIPLVKKQKEEELQQLQQGLQKFQQQAMMDFEKKKQDLLAPIYEKAQKGINEVAEAEGYTYIISSNAGTAPILIYASEEAQKNHDITEKVVKKLGGTMPEEEGEDAGNE